MPEKWRGRRSSNACLWHTLLNPHWNLIVRDQHKKLTLSLLLYIPNQNCNINTYELMNPPVCTTNQVNEGEPLRILIINYKGRRLYKNRCYRGCWRQRASNLHHALQRQNAITHCGPEERKKRGRNNVKKRQKKKAVESCKVTREPQTQVLCMSPARAYAHSFILIVCVCVCVHVLACV